MSKPRLTLTLASLALCGVSFAAFAPAPQGMPAATREHKLIQKDIGEYTGVMKMTMPGAPAPMESRCSEVITPVGALWTTGRFETEFMGMAFVGSSTLGYDPEEKKFIGTWIDGFHSKLTLMEGTFDEAKQAIVMEYESPDEMTGEMKHMRSEHVSTADGYTMKFFHVKGDEAILEMEMNMTKKPAVVEAGTAK